MKKRYILAFGIACVFSASAVAQELLTGVIKNQQQQPVLGASVSLVGNPSKKTITDENGAFSLDARKGDYIEIVVADGQRKRVWVTDPVMDISLTDFDLSSDLQLSLGTQTSRTQAVSTLSSDELAKNSTVSISDALYGLIPGLIVKQNTGWTDTAELMVRGGGSLSGRTPLIVVDGFPRDLKYLNLSDVESISVLKDGAATALWGTRGANGVILINTKRGQYEKMHIDLNYTYGIGLPINQPEFVDGYTYAKLRNEALYYDGLPLQYDKAALEAFKNGSNPDLFANTDWQKEALRNHSINNQLNIVLKGGGKRMRYYSSINYKSDCGILDTKWTDYSDRYNSQMKKYDLNARINLDVDVTQYTRAAVSLFGLLREENRPNKSEGEIFSSLYHVPSGAFPVRTSSGAWGSNLMYKKNPIAQIADVGYYRQDRRMLQADMRIFQDLSMVTKGLHAEAGVAYDNEAVYRDIGSKTYSYEVNIPVYLPAMGEYDVQRTTYDDDSALSIDNGWLDGQYIRSVLEAKVGYDRAFGLHAVNGTLQYSQESYTPMGRNNTRKRQSMIAAAGYNYADRYMVDVMVNRGGTSVLSKGDKYRIYPAASAAWVISNEKFMKKASAVDFLKLRASWGRSGNDNIGYDLDKRFWENCGGFLVNNPPMNPANAGGLHPGALPISNLTIELADKYNVGVDAQFFGKRFSLTADAFYDQRKDMLVTGNNIYSAAIGTGIPQQNVGRMDSKGADLSLMWKDDIRKSFKYYIGGTLSYLKTEIKEDGQGYQPYDYLYHRGNAYYQNYGLEAIGYFRDEADIKNSPKQMFSDVRPGDIKYKDQNGDGRIDDYDVVKIGYSSVLPEFYYGINLGFEYKGFGVDAVFQGVGHLSKMLNVQSVYWPLRNGNSNISTWYLDDKIRWMEGTEDIANAPRLTTLDNANNFRNSTQWLENGAYFKLRNLNIYYNLPQKWVKSMRMQKCQVYARGNNLFSLDHIKQMNCEDFSINYPDMTSIYFGVNINF